MPLAAASRLASSPEGGADKAAPSNGAKFFSRVALVFASVLLLAARPAAAAENIAHEIVVVVGAAGEEKFQSGFNAAAEAWKNGCARANATCTVIGLSVGTSEPSADGSSPRAAPNDHDRESLKARLASADPQAATPFWLVYIGHGTFDGKQALLNVRGPDVSSEELAGWLAPLKERQVIIVNGGSASGPFVPLLSGPNRIVISATRSAEEVNYARFGERFADAVGSAEADIDRDGSTSVLEAFLSASQRVNAEYKEANRLASEHALIDDNGDKLGTPAEWFEGVRVVKRPDKGGAVDGFRAHQIALMTTAAEQTLTAEQRRTRDGLEQELEKLRARKAQLAEPEYLRELEIILRKLAAIYLPTAKASPPTSP